MFSPVVSRAQVGEVPINSNPLFGWTSLLSKDVIKEYLLDVAGRIIAGGIIRNLSNQVVGWIQGGNGQNVGFVANLQQELRKTADETGADFLNGISGINFCGDIGQYLRISLRSPTTLRRQFECTVTGVRGNIKNYYQNFRNGGWSAFLQTTIDVQNDPYGAFLIAYDAKLKAESDARYAKESTLAQNRGFLGFQVERRKCEQIPFSEDDPYAPTEICFKEKVTKTPGGLVADTLSKATGSGFDFAVVADELDEAIASIANALIGKLISGSITGDTNGGGTTGNSGGQGLFNPELGTVPVGTEIINSEMFKEVQSVLLGAPNVIAAIDAKLVVALADLFAARTEINTIVQSSDFFALQVKTTADRLAELRTQATTHETTLHDFAEQKKDLLISERELFTFVDNVTGGQNAREQVEAIQNLPAILEQFKNVANNTGTDLPAPSSDLATNILDIIQGMRANISSEIETINSVIAAQSNLLPIPSGATASTTALRAEITAKIAALTPHKTSLTDAQNELTPHIGSISSAADILRADPVSTAKTNELTSRIGQATIALASDASQINTAHTAVTAVRARVIEYLEAVAP